MTRTLSRTLSSTSTAWEGRTKNRAHVSEFPGLTGTLNQLSLLFLSVNRACAPWGSEQHTLLLWEGHLLVTPFSLLGIPCSTWLSSHSHFPAERFNTGLPLQSPALFSRDRPLLSLSHCDVREL